MERVDSISDLQDQAIVIAESKPAPISLPNSKDKKTQLENTNDKTIRDDSNTKTSNERTHCNSSIINAHRQGLGTVFSFKSQKMPQ